MVKFNGQFTGKKKTKILRVSMMGKLGSAACVCWEGGGCSLIFDFKTDFSWRLHLGT